MTFKTRPTIQTVTAGILLIMVLAFDPPNSLAQIEILKNGLESITEKKVRDTVSFLASDEMAGRDTPSPELKKAAEYVAGRFQKAGLAPGHEGSFFQIESLATVELDNQSVRLKSGGKDIRHFGLLGAGDKAFQATGKLLEAKPEDLHLEYENSPVRYRPASIETPADELHVARMVARLKRKRASAVLIEVEPDCRLIDTASKNSRPRIINPRGRYSLPTLLVPKLDPEAEYDIEIPAFRSGETDVRNVIGLVRGSDPDLSKEAIIISAHLDHIGRRNELDDPVFNGADDNATGVTGVIALAEAYAALPEPPRRTMIFMTFWGEEKGLLGSRNYVNDPSWPLEKTVANINLEMIGRPEAGARGKCWMTGWGHSDLGSLMAIGAKQVDVEIFEHPRYSSNMLYRASDNASFVDKGVIGHSFSAGSLHRDYHQPGDEWQKLEIKHMTRVIKGLFAGSYQIANGKFTPQKTQRRRE